MKKFEIFDEFFVGVHICKKEIKLNKSIFLGQNILDDSKHLMFYFHYNFIFKTFKREYRYRQFMLSYKKSGYI